MRLCSIAAASLALIGSPLLAQDDGAAEVVVTAQRISNSLSTPIGVAAKPPVIGLRRQADSAVRNIAITSDSREEGMRRREVEAMLLAALDRAKANGMVLVTGQFELTEVTRDNWRDQFPGLGGKTDAAQDDDDDDDYDDRGAPPPSFEDDGGTTTVRLKVKTRLEGSIGSAHDKINRFVKAVPATGRSQIEQHGGLALTIVNPAQYRDRIYTLVADGAKHAQSFYGTDYGLDVTGLDGEIAWKQVSNTEVFLYLPYSFTVRSK